MTESEFLALPDREKDAVVAEKVMGWRFINDPTELARINGHDGDPVRWHMKGEWHSGRGREACVECGNMEDFTTTWDGMRQVVERMRSLGFQWLHGSTVIDGDQPWAIFRKHGTEAGHADADTDPLAVAVAALKALGAITEAP